MAPILYIYPIMDKYTKQNVSNLSERQINSIKSNNYKSKSGQEYCVFALEARLVELKIKKASKYASSQDAAIAEFNSMVQFPPPIIKSYVKASTIVGQFDVNGDVALLAKNSLKNINKAYGFLIKY